MPAENWVKSTTFSRFSFSLSLTRSAPPSVRMSAQSSSTRRAVSLLTSAAARHYCHVTYRATLCSKALCCALPHSAVMPYCRVKSCIVLPCPVPRLCCALSRRATRRVLNVEDNINTLVEDVAQCKFESTNNASDEIVLLNIVGVCARTLGWGAHVRN